jgi:hypothetical protein
MAVSFFYGSIAAIWIVFLICTVRRPLSLKHLIIAIAGIGYSLLYETFLGEYSELYYYINKEHSLLYIIISAILIYPVIEVIYTLFLPEKVFSAVLYTAVWIVLMLAFELLSFYTGTVVLTGWRVIPWSIITYIVTFIWVNLLFIYLKKRGL